MAKVCIGFPVFNGEKYPTVSIDSIMPQTYGNFKFIVCDNASTDRPQEICNE